MAKFQKRKSDRLNRFYFLADEDHKHPHEGLPVFSKREMQLMSHYKQYLTDDDWQSIFNAKAESGGTVDYMVNFIATREKERRLLDVKDFASNEFVSEEGEIKSRVELLKKAIDK